MNKTKYTFSCQKTGKQYITVLTNKEFNKIKSIKFNDLDEAVSKLPKQEVKTFKKIKKVK